MITKRLKKEYPFHLMLIPGVCVVLVYAYGPMVGLIMAFQKYYPQLGFFKSKWVGLKNFQYIFKMPDFYNALGNTLSIAIVKIILFIVVPLTIALLINELTHKHFIKFVQTSIFLPYFLSWTILGGVIFEIFSLNGPINGVLEQLFHIKPIFFLGSNDWFRKIIISTDVWKSMGFNMVVFLAALTSINPNLYEAASVDGANRWSKTLHITLPGMAPIIVLLMTLSIGSILNAGFEQILILYSPIVYKSGDVIDTFVYRMGIFNNQYSPAAAIGLFKSFVSCFLVSISYYLAYKFSDYRIF